MVTNNAVRFKGQYFCSVNNGAVEVFDNLITAEGVKHILDVALGRTDKPAGYYLALFGGSAVPAANWTAASFANTAGELTGQTEGYTEAARPQWVATAAVGNGIDNMGGRDDVGGAAKVTIASASSLTATGAALLTSPAKGATTGVLVSAMRFPVPRMLQNGDVFYIGYRLSLTE